MSRARVRCSRIGHSGYWDLLPGSIIGRLTSAACRIIEPDISEAHALVSLRGETFHLMALRGTVRVDEDEVSELPLEVGTEVELGRGVVLRVEEVVVPDRIPAIRVDADRPQALIARVYSLVDKQGAQIFERPRWVPRFEPASLAQVISTGDEWSIRRPGHRPTAWRAGREWTIGTHTLTACWLDSGDAATPHTIGARAAGLTIQARFVTCNLCLGHAPPVVLQGHMGRLVSELAVSGVSWPWQTLAQQLWPALADRERLRRRWDRLLRRVKRKLAEKGIRQDLVRSDGQGNVELHLYLNDKVVDQT